MKIKSGLLLGFIALTSVGAQPLAAAGRCADAAGMPNCSSVNTGMLVVGRIGAKDVLKLEPFYIAAFDLKRIAKLEFPGLLEVVLAFGSTIEEAKSNGDAKIVVMSRPNDDIKDPVPHLVISVPDIFATATAIKANGGTLDSDPRQIRPGEYIVMGADPIGNRFEVLQLLTSLNDKRAPAPDTPRG